jgi:hypothetical protein
MTRQLTYAIALLLGLGGCQGAFLEEGGAFTPPAGASTCPTDPDAFIGGDPTLYVCPDFWVCEELSGPIKRCTNPGPRYPDGSGDWDCWDEGGTTVCRGHDFPDGGGDSDWRCERQDEFVICRSDSPDYPDGGSGGDWDCRFVDTYRVCESGGDNPGGGDYPDGGDDVCFYPVGDPTGGPVVHAQYTFETIGGRDTVHIVLIFDEGFVDNSYGANSSDGYRGGHNGHTFRDLVSSDHAEVGFLDAGGTERLRAKFDYISPAPTPTGYDALGATGGDGSMMGGDAGAVVDASSSLAWNFNTLGCVFTEDSPSPAECPDWENRVIYEMWIDLAAFPGGFGMPALEYVHASPSRTTDTIEVYPDECP